MIADSSLVETHSAVVVFVGDRAYKVKKPVDLGFLDFRTVAARGAACHREVELNRRLAPDVYLGVADVVGPDGDVWEHVVVMRRLPDERRLSRVLETAAPEAVDDALWSIARQIAALHARPDDGHPLHSVASVDSVRRRWTDGFEQLATLRTLLDPGVEDRIEHLALRYLDGRRRLFDARIADDHIRDGHGDLQADDIFVLDDGPRILDCLDFDDELRWGDVVGDVAFLAMDLERLGHPDAAVRFLAHYRELSGERWPPSLAHHHIAYRAHVRAKVTAVRAAQTGAADARIDQLQRLCFDHLERGRVRMVLVGGAPGTGKSTVAAALGDRQDAVVVRTDELRDPSVDDADRYSAAAVAATYERMLRRAGELLSLGEHVVLDATWGSTEHREAARRVAAEHRADVVELRCDAPADECARRIEARRERGDDPSEATPEVAALLRERFAPWPEATTVDTTVAPDDAAARAVEAWQERS